MNHHFVSSTSLARQEIEETIHQLAARYPQCFFDEPRLRRPLTRDIVNDLIADGFPSPKEALVAVVEWYKHNFGYQYALQAGANRIDLNGKIVAKVTKQEELEAGAYVARQKEMNARRKNSVQTVIELHRAGEVTDDALRKLPVDEHRVMPRKSVSLSTDPVARLQSKVDEVRRATKDLSDPALRNAITVAGLGVLIKEAERMVAELSAKFG